MKNHFFYVDRYSGGNVGRGYSSHRGRDWNGWNGMDIATAQNWIATTTSGHKSDQQQCHEPHQWFGEIFEAFHLFLLCYLIQETSVQLTGIFLVLVLMCYANIR